MNTSPHTQPGGVKGRSPLRPKAVIPAKAGIAYLAFFLCAVTSPSHAQQFDLQQLQSAVMSNPQLQQAIGQAAVQQAAANPAALAGGFATMTPQQSQLFGQQARDAIAKLLTPAEQSKLTAFTASPEGQGIAAKLPAIAQALAPIVMRAYMGQTNTGPAAANTVAPAAGAYKLQAAQPAAQPATQPKLKLTPTGGK